jgi:hypothetical protein
MKLPAHEPGRIIEQDALTLGGTIGLTYNRETLKAGLPVFYRDWNRGRDVREQPDGRKFEVRFISGALRGSTYCVIRELDEMAV